MTPHPPPRSQLPTLLTSTYPTNDGVRLLPGGPRKVPGQDGRRWQLGRRAEAPCTEVLQPVHPGAGLLIFPGPLPIAPGKQLTPLRPTPTTVALAHAPRSPFGFRTHVPSVCVRATWAKRREHAPSFGAVTATLRLATGRSAVRHTCRSAHSSRAPSSGAADISGDLRAPRSTRCAYPPGRIRLQAWPAHRAPSAATRRDLRDHPTEGRSRGCHPRPALVIITHPYAVHVA